MLFDGVCNLCNAAVQWVLARDPEGRIHFASLQSDAAAGELAKHDAVPRPVPDSFILIDDHGVRVRSSAAIGVARHLGFPYSLLALGLIIPRPVRDAVYAVVARNRYRWFGRRESCLVPTAENAARFLDADEEPRVDAGGTDPARTDEVGRGRASIRAWLPRLAIAYALVYMAPFPLTLLAYLSQIPFVGEIPGLGAVVGTVVGLHGVVMTPIVEGFGTWVFGRGVSPVATGSGDTSFQYADVGIDVMLAVVIATGWTVGSRGRRVGATTVDVSRTLARYYLATTMLSSGWIKAFPLQFPLPGPDRLIQPYGDSSPMGLAWTFLGASVGYQVFAGLSELLGGYLLLWRRTSALGALASVAVLTNVVAVNVFYDVPVKLFSGHLLLVALFLVAPEVPRLVGLLVFNLPAAARRIVPSWHGTARTAGWMMTVHLVFVGVVTSVHVTSNLAMSRTRGVLAKPDPLVGIYRVEAFEQDGVVGRENEDTARWVRVGLNTFVGTIQRASGDAIRMRSVVDGEAGTMSFFERGVQPPIEPMFRFTVVEPGVLRLEGVFEGKSTVVVMRKDERGTLLRNRGFRWINEFPFNR